MCAVLDDLVVALYVTVDELLGKRSRPGRPPRLSDAELVCLAVAQVLATPKLGEREVASALLGGWPATRGCCARGWSSPPTRAWPATGSPKEWVSSARCWSGPTAVTSRIALEAMDLAVAAVTTWGRLVGLLG